MPNIANNPSSLGQVGGNTGWSIYTDSGFLAASCFVVAPGGGRVMASLQARPMGFSIPADATITGLRASILQDGSGGTLISGGSSVSAEVYIAGVSLLVGTGTSSSIDFNFPTGGSTWHNFGGQGSLWGRSWTPSEINSGNFGIQVHHRQPQAGLSHRLNRWEATVWYTTPGSTTIQSQSRVFIPATTITGKGKIYVQLPTSTPEVGYGGGWAGVGGFGRAHGEALVQAIAQGNATINGVSSIKKSISTTIVGSARIRQTLTTTIMGTGSIKKQQTTTIPGLANITSSLSQTISGRANIRKTVSSTIDGKASIYGTNQTTIQGVGAIYGSYTTNINGVANIRKTLSTTVVGRASIITAGTTVISGRASISQRHTTALQGRSAIARAVQSTIDGTASIYAPVELSITGLASILNKIKDGGYYAPDYSTGGTVGEATKDDGYYAKLTSQVGFIGVTNMILLGYEDGYGMEGEDGSIIIPEHLEIDTNYFAKETKTNGQY